MSHRVVLNFDDGLHAKLICPETGCKPASLCGECYRDVNDPETKPCPCCPDPASLECWVKTWFDGCTWDELLHGEVTVEIDAEWDGDSMIANIVAPVEVEVPDA